MINQTTDNINKFWSRVLLPLSGGCWEWLGRKTSAGYGLVTLDHKVYYAHRFSYETHKGPIPKGLCICHSCDMPQCTNPDHLWAGTQRDNMQDMVSKGRCKIPVFYGEDASLAKFTWEQIREMRILRRDNHLSTYEIAELFGTDRSNVSLIIRNKTWVEKDVYWLTETYSGATKKLLRGMELETNVPPTAGRWLN